MDPFRVGCFDRWTLHQRRQFATKNDEVQIRRSHSFPAGETATQFSHEDQQYGANVHNNHCNLYNADANLCKLVPLADEAIVRFKFTISGSLSRTHLCQRLY